MLIRLLLICITALLVNGCGGDFTDKLGTGSSAPGQSVQQQNNQITGRVYRVNPLIFVDDPSNAPAGSRPQLGQLVELVDRNGQIIASARTDSTGLFTLNPPAGGLLRVQVTVPGASTPELVQELSYVPGTKLVLGRKFALSREQATNLALQNVSKEAQVAATLLPLPAGTRVGTSFQVQGLAHVPEMTLTADSWFFFVNLEPVAEFFHPVEYVLVDAASGELTRIQAQFPPAINGRIYWSGDLDLFDLEGFDVDRVTDYNSFPNVRATPTSELIQLGEVVLPQSTAPATRQSRELRFQNNTDADSVFAVLVVGWAESRKYADLVRFRARLTQQGVPLANIYTVLPDEDSPDAVKLRRDARLAVLNANARIEERLEQGQHSTLIYWITAHGAGEVTLEAADGEIAGYNVSEMVASGPETTEDGTTRIPTGLGATRACRVRVFLNYCGSGGVVPLMMRAWNRIGEHDVEIYAASAPGRVCHGSDTWVENATIGIFPEGNAFVIETANLLRIENGDVAGLQEGNRLVGFLEKVSPGGLVAEIVNGVSFEYINAYVSEPIFAFRRDTPSWCVEDGLFTVVPPGTETSLFLPGHSPCPFALGNYTVTNPSDEVVEVELTRDPELAVDLRPNSDVSEIGLDRYRLQPGSTATFSVVWLCGSELDFSGTIEHTYIAPGVTDPIVITETFRVLEEQSDFRLDLPSLEFTHRVGVDGCPQQLENLVITNSGNQTACFEVTVPPGAPLAITGEDGLGGVLPAFATCIGPGESATFGLRFTCNPPESFTTNLIVKAAPLGSEPEGPEQQNLQIPVAGTLIFP